MNVRETQNLSTVVTSSHTLIGLEMSCPVGLVSGVQHVDLQLLTEVPSDRSPTPNIVHGKRSSLNLTLHQPLLKPRHTPQDQMDSPILVSAGRLAG